MPLDTITRRVTDVAARCASEKGGPPGEGVTLSQLGLTSLDIVSFIVELERAFGVRFPAHMINQQVFATIGSVSEAVHTLRQGAGDD